MSAGSIFKACGQKRDPRSRGDGHGGNRRGKRRGTEHGHTGVSRQCATAEKRHGAGGLTRAAASIGGTTGRSAALEVAARSIRPPPGTGSDAFPGRERAGRTAAQQTPAQRMPSSQDRKFSTIFQRDVEGGPRHGRRQKSGNSLLNSPFSGNARVAQGARRQQERGG
jgi:hypothetical protein